VDERDYRAVVELLLRGLATSPRLLLDPLVERMHRLAEGQRYEEAATLRDRHNALARALETRRLWQALHAAGYMVVEDGGGHSVVIDHGRLVETGPTEEVGLHQKGAEAGTPGGEVPPNVEAAEEGRLLWAWLTQDAVRLLEIGGRLSLPREPVTLLRPVGARAA
jgi:DNA polymerase-3 subunit epsilon